MLEHVCALHHHGRPFWHLVLLSSNTDRGVAKSYYGITGLRHGQSAAEACANRKRNHKSYPLKWVCRAVASTLSIQPLETLCHRNALAQEAIHTARALVGNADGVRGACWSGPDTGAPWRASAAAVRRATKGLSGQEARQAFLTYVSTLSEEEPLWRHMAGQPFAGARSSKQKLPQGPRRASGTPGHLWRRTLGKMPKSDAKRLHRGSDPKAKRAAENKKRQPLRRKLGA